MLITGASRGIGRAVATSAASRGAKVGLIARGREDLDAVARALGDGHALATADVAEPDQLTAAIGKLEAELGPTDILVANAGIGAYGPFAEVDPVDIERLVRVNVLGTMHAIRTVVPGMIERRRGHIVTLGSIAGRVGAPFEALYSATKFAQVGLTEALSVELSPYGIGVSMVNPGPVETDFFEARGHAYDRKSPKPVPAQQVADAVMAAVDSKKLEQYVPKWLRSASIVRHLAPPVFLSGTKRAFRKELAGR